MTRRFTKFPPEVVELCRQQGIRPSDVKRCRVGTKFTVVTTFTGRRACLPLTDLMLSYRSRVGADPRVCPDNHVAADHRVCRHPKGD